LILATRDLHKSKERQILIYPLYTRYTKCFYPNAIADSVVVCYLQKRGDKLTDFHDMS